MSRASWIKSVHKPRSREPKRARASKHHQNSRRKPSETQECSAIAGKRWKKNAKFLGLPPFGTHPSTPQQSGTPILRAPPGSGAHNLPDPPCRAPTPWPQWNTPRNRPKSKLPKVEIGRSGAQSGTAFFFLSLYGGRGGEGGSGRRRRVRGREEGRSSRGIVVSMQGHSPPNANSVTSERWPNSGQIQFPKKGLAKFGHSRQWCLVQPPCD